MSKPASETPKPDARVHSDGPGRLPDELILIIAGYFLNTKCETNRSKDCNPRLSVLLAPAGLFSNAWYAENKGPGNGPEVSYSGGCDPGASSFGGFCSPELVHSPLGPQGSKRKRRARDPAQPLRSTSIKQAARTFACPYYFHDRIRHSDCLNIRLTRLSDVRQHLLERAHYQAVHCPVCGNVFQGRLADARRLRDAHVQARTCQRSPFPFNYPGITEDGEERIREIARNNRTNQVTEVHRWYMIWDFLFPGEQRPDSPFLNDLPEFQRVVDWSNTMFDNDLWLELPIEPWTAAMDLEQRRAGMFHFIGRFIVLARDLVVQDASPVEDHHGPDGSSYMGFNTPAPSVASANSGIAQPTSTDPGPLYLSPTQATGLQQAQGSRTLGRMEPSISHSSHAVPRIPLRPMNGPPVPQDMQQPAPPEQAADVQHDPTVPSLAVEGLPVDTYSLEDWLSSMFTNEDTSADHNPDPSHEDEFGRHQ